MDLCLRNGNILKNESTKDKVIKINEQSKKHLYNKYIK